MVKLLQFTLNCFKTVLKSPDININGRLFKTLDVTHLHTSKLLPVTMNIIIDLSNIMYNDLWMWNKTKLN
jgi:hypothetical protein